MNPAESLPASEPASSSDRRSESASSGNRGPDDERHDVAVASSDRTNAVDGAARRRIKSFVTRAGRVSKGQQRAIETLGPQFVLPYQPVPADWDAVFDRPGPLILEIGFGMGATTAEIAAARADDNFLGVEVHGPGVGALLKLIGEKALHNVRVLQHDAVEVVENMIAPGTLQGVHVFFPDPWHKSRHNKRRLIQPAFVALLASRLAPGGYLHCATDWQPYAEQMLEVLDAEAMLRNTAEGYAPRPAYRPVTKFEARGLRLGHGVWDLIYTRR